MSPRRSSKPVDKQERSASDKSTRKQRITNSSQELNRNEERTSPSGIKRPSDQWKQRNQDLDRSSGRQTPLTERPDIASKGWNQGSQERNQTTGSNVPGAEIPDRKNPSESLDQKTSGDQFPTNSKSSPNKERSDIDQKPLEKKERVAYTGNSERTGQQYSVTDNSSQKKDQELQTGHPKRDKQGMHRSESRKRPKSSNQGMKEQRSENERLPGSRLNKAGKDKNLNHE